ncbi:hypothetical protein HDU83_008852 [Entophlyctis luteolus]|nr:hypothetical protein HDU83_008852 [Entophlyctis luteolus]
MRTAHVLEVIFRRQVPDTPEVSVVVGCFAAYQGDRELLDEHYPQMAAMVTVNAMRPHLKRGIRHSLHFAKSWASNPKHEDADLMIMCSERLIVSDDLSFIHPKAYCIWAPRLARRETYIQLARDHPSMKRLAARACLLARYSDEFEALQCSYDYAFVVHALELGDVHLAKRLLQKAKAEGVDFRITWMDDFNQRLRDKPEVVRETDDESIRTFFSLAPAAISEIRSNYTAHIYTGIADVGLVQVDGSEQLHGLPDANCERLWNKIQITYQKPAKAPR